MAGAGRLRLKSVRMKRRGRARAHLSSYAAPRRTPLAGGARAEVRLSQRTPDLIGDENAHSVRLLVLYSARSFL